MRMINKRLLTRSLRPLFYAVLDVLAGTAIYVISLGEADLTSGQLAIRVLTGMALASAIVGGPDIMLYWQESGRRIAAEDERDATAKERDAATKERDATAKELAAAVKKADEVAAERDAFKQRLDELSAEMEQMRNGRSSRRSRSRRRLRNNSR